MDNRGRALEEMRRDSYRQGLKKGFPEGYSLSASKAIAETFKAVIRESLESAAAAGVRQGELITLVGLIRDGKISETDAANSMDIDLDEFVRLANSEYLQEA